LGKSNQSAFFGITGCPIRQARRDLDRAVTKFDKSILQNLRISDKMVLGLILSFICRLKQGRRAETPGEQSKDLPGRCLHSPLSH
jgi:hypothetical protein